MGPRASRVFFSLSLLAGSLWTAPSLPAQKEVPLETIGPGYLVVRAQVCRGGVKMDRHLLLDLLCPVPLVYFPGEALFLGIRRKKGEKVDLEMGDARLKGVPVLLAKLGLLQELTRDYATELGEIPVTGILGYPALAGYKIELDPIDEILRLFPPALQGDPPAGGPERWVLPLVLDQGPPRLEATLAGKVKGFLYLATGSPHSFLFSGALSRAGLEGKAVKDLVAGKAQLAGIVPFRSMEVEDLFYRLPGPLLGGLGWDFLRSFRVVLDGVNRRVLFERVRHEPFPEEEQAFVLAKAGGAGSLRAFLKAHPRSPFAAEAAKDLFLLLKEEAAPAKDLARAGMSWAGLLPPPKRAGVYLQVARALMEFPPYPEEAEGILLEGIRASRLAEEKEAAYRLQHLAGRFYLERKAFRKARRHLLNAVFGLIHEGPVNLDMGRCWEGLGKPGRAMGAYLRALLDPKKSGPEALGRLEGLWDRDFGKGRRLGFTEKLIERLEGRVPAFQAPGKPRAVPFHPPHRPLVELFSGADCDPCAGADLAFEGAAAFFGAGAVFLCHHLHVPSPDPLTIPAGYARARRLGVRGTPTLFVDGELVLDGGGGANKAGSLFQKVREALEKARAGKPRWILSGSGRVLPGGKAVQGKVRVQGPPCRVQVWLAAARLVYPGTNGIVIHRYVSRARLLPRGGVSPGPGGWVSFRADLASKWKEIRDSLQDVEDQLQEKDFHFRWKPDRPDPAELVFVAVVHPPGTSTPGESLLILPQGLPRKEKKGASQEGGTGSRPASRPGKVRLFRGGKMIRVLPGGGILKKIPGKKGGSGH